MKTGRFVAGMSEESSQLAIRLGGHADMPEVVDALSALWMRVHARALDLKAPVVTVDLRTLEFMSSSCFRTFVVWLSHLAQAKDGERYRVRFLSDATRYWQRKGLQVLSAFARDVVTVE
ncbi:MAG TPA: hypothetical protein VFA20_05550 [Myxococcaceae bacterium]|nr:hypothetical protein [Myxococcaceae bacterium]